MVSFQGLHHDTATGLVYNRARMLNPILGRFNQRDPWGTWMG
jgi:RHS repeat-associated protein